MKKYFILLGIFILITFSVATFLTVKYYNGSEVRCSILEGCKTVTTSAYSKIGPIPIALLGALYDLTLIVFFVAVIDTRKKELFRLFAWYTLIGALASLIFLGLQFFVLHAVCIYCLTSDIASIVVAIVAMLALRKLRYHPHLTVS